MKVKNAYPTLSVPFYVLLFLLSTNPCHIFSQNNHIRNFRSVDNSPILLQVTVDYFFDGKGDTSTANIYATVLDASGKTLAEFINGDQLRMQPGSHTVTLHIRKKKQNFTTTVTSSLVHVCMTANRSSILCQDFHKTKTWSIPAGAQVSKTPAIDSCIIRGHLNGNLRWEVKDLGEMLNGTYTVKAVNVESSDGKIKKTIRIDGLRDYKVRLPSGKTYKIYIPSFHTEPQFVKVVASRQLKIPFQANFTIKGPILE